MNRIFEYQILDVLRSTSYEQVLRVAHTGTNETGVVTILENVISSAAEKARFQHIADKIKRLNFEGCVRLLDVRPYESGFALIWEDGGGESLDVLLRNGALSLKQFLTIAVSLSRTLAKIHDHNVIHRAVRPCHIYYNRAAGKVRLGHFGVSSILTRETGEIYDRDVFARILPYIAPEQTGRMNRPVDYRADFYSLGVVFYEMLTGVVPFPSTEPMELVHAHIARLPVLPGNLNRHIPFAVSQIVMRLLAKAPEDRYQSGLGLAADLGVCLEQLESGRAIEPFALAKQDIAIRFGDPSKLFGRDAETATLREVLDRVKGGHSGMLLVSGGPGVGKSSLIQTLHRPVVEHEGFFLKGKFEAFRRDVPYNAIIKAFRPWVRQIVSGSKTRLREWQERIMEAAGDNSRVLLDIIPDIALILGELPELPRLDPEDSQNRFHLVLKRFIQSMAEAARPLVLFLDDLQWADSASLKLIRNLFSGKPVRYFLLIGAYRDNQPQETAPVLKTVNYILGRNVETTHVPLSELDNTAVNEFIADFLKCSLERSLPLSRLVQLKTNGNPFYIHQFLYRLHREGLLVIDPESGWQWDMEKIRHKRVTENVLEMMLDGIVNLQAGLKEALMICACIGHTFSLETVATVLEKPIAETYQVLGAAVAEGIIDRNDNIYTFHHDRIHEVVYDMISNERKIRFHHRIGRAILQQTAPESFQENIFKIVGQLNLGMSLIFERRERFELARLNLLAGLNAKDAAAYEAAHRYFTTGIALVGADGWEGAYEDTLALFEEAAETAYLTTQYDKMARLADELIANAACLLDQIKVYEIKIKTSVAQNALQQAIDIGLEVLRLLGIRFPDPVMKRHILQRFIFTHLTLRRRTVEDLLKLPCMEEPEKMAAMRIIDGITSAAYFSKPSLLPLLIFKMLMLSVRYGNAAGAPYQYATYGMMLCTLGRIEDGYRFGKVAEALMARPDGRSQRARTRVALEGFVNHWKVHARKSLQGLQMAYMEGMNGGDTEFAAHALLLHSWVSFQVTRDLPLLEQEIGENEERLQPMKQELPLQLTRLCHEAVISLTRGSGAPGALSGERYAEERMLPIHIATRDRTSLCTYYITKLFLLFTFGRYEAAQAVAEKAAAEADAIKGLLYSAAFVFYDALVCIALSESAGMPDRKRLLRHARRNRKRMTHWAGHAPMNFKHKQDLINAELCRVSGDRNQAICFYQQAVSAAGRNGYLQDEALAYEMAARCYRNLGDAGLASLYMAAAREKFAKWGALRKIRHLEETYPDLLQLPPVPRSFALNNDADQMTVVKALQAISTEIILEQLIKALLKTMAEIAGAGRVVFISVKNNQLFVEAERRVDQADPDSDVIMIQRAIVEKADSLLLPAVNYVNSTLQCLVVEDAGRHEIYSAEAYVETNKVKSVLCLPVIRQTRLIGVLYMENNAVAAAFTEERVEILQLLSSQAAISFENAFLYKNISEAESALRDSEKKYRLLAENVTDLIWILDLATMRFVYQTPSMRDMLGFSPEEGQAIKVEEILTPGSYRKAESVLREAFVMERRTDADPNRTRTLELESRRKDGVIVWTESTVRFLRDTDGKPVRLLGVTRDISARKRAEDEVQQLNAELEQRVVKRTAELRTSLTKLQEAQHQLVQSEKMAALGGLVAGIAHEINTPLGIGVTAATFLKDRAESFAGRFENDELTEAGIQKFINAAVEAASIIHTNLSRAGELIASFKKVAVDQTHEERRKFLLKGYIEDILHSLQPKLKKTQHRVVVNCPEDLMIDSYPGALSQIITNLVLNSLMHGFEGIPAGEMCFDIAVEANTTIMQYRDNGRGMDAMTLQKIFDPFYTTKRNQGGTGLGMHILYNLVTQSLGGSIDVQSAPDQGATFSIRFPLGSAARAGEQAAALTA